MSTYIQVARTWHIDVATFLIEHHAEVNKADKFGRTPLHVAAAVDYPEMVDKLIKHGGKILLRRLQRSQNRPFIIFLFIFTKMF